MNASQAPTLNVISVTGGVVHEPGSGGRLPACRPGSQSGLGVTGRKSTTYKNTTKPATCKACAKLTAATVTEAPASAPEIDQKVTECAECGYEFRRPQNRRTCRNEAACKRRQAADAAGRTAR